MPTLSPITFTLPNVTFNKIYRIVHQEPHHSISFKVPSFKDGEYKIDVRVWWVFYNVARCTLFTIHRRRATLLRQMEEFKDFNHLIWTIGTVRQRPVRITKVFTPSLVLNRSRLSGYPERYSWPFFREGILSESTEQNGDWVRRLIQDNIQRPLLVSNQRPHLWNPLDKPTLRP